jgi:hypothetical protein
VGKAMQYGTPNATKFRFRNRFNVVKSDFRAIKIEQVIDHNIDPQIDRRIDPQINHKIDQQIDCKIDLYKSITGYITV